MASLAKEMREEMYASRHIILQVFIRDLKAAYRKSYLGYLWAVIPGLTTRNLDVSKLSKHHPSSRNSIPYPLYVLIGSTLWIFFTSSVTSPLGSFQGGSGVFMKLKVSPFAFILAGLGSLLSIYYSKSPFLHRSVYGLVSHHLGRPSSSFLWEF